MACKNCQENSKSGNGYIKPEGLHFPPFNSGDIMVYSNGDVRKLQADDWSNDRHKLILFFPQTFTPVCSTEMGAINDWVGAFNEQNCDVFAATTDPIHSVKDWYESEESLSNPQYKTLSSYILPTRLGIMHNGRAKRASVFITKDKDVIVSEHFMKVGRSIEELHRQIFAYNTDNYCAEGWTSPKDGFLKNDNDTQEA